MWGMAKLGEGRDTRKKRAKLKIRIIIKKMPRKERWRAGGLTKVQERNIESKKKSEMMEVEIRARKIVTKENEY